MVSNVPNIHIGIYKNYQNFHPLMFYGYTRLRGVGVDLPHPGWNMVNSKGQLLHGWFWLSPWAWEGSMRWRRRRRRWILERCRQSLMVITSLRLNCDDEIHRSESLHNVLLFTHNVIHTNQTFQAKHYIVSMAWQSHSCCTKSTDWPTVPNKDQSAQSCPKVLKVFLYCSGLIGEPKSIFYCSFILYC